MRAPGGSLLATSTVCPKCGFANQAGYQFCSNCGNPLGPAQPQAAAPAYGVPPPMAAPAGYPMPYGYGPSPWEYERSKQIDRTKTGVLLLLIGSLISWVPLVQVVGYLLLFIGAILVIMGRKAFGDVHARNVIVSLVLFIVGVAAAIFAFIAFFSAIIVGAIAGITGTQPTLESIRNAVTGYYVSAIAVSAVLGIAEVLFIYALQNPQGKLLLWGAFAVSIVLQISIYVVISGGLAAALAEAFATTTPNVAPISTLMNQTSWLSYLSVIPAALFAAADYIVWSRINRGELPARAQPQAAAMPGMPPAPPMPPR